MKKKRVGKKAGASGPVVDPAAEEGAADYTQPPPYPAPESLAPSPAPEPEPPVPSPQPITINVQQNVKKVQPNAPTVPLAPMLKSDQYEHDSIFCYCAYCGHSVFF